MSVFLHVRVVDISDVSSQAAAVRFFESTEDAPLVPNEG